MFQKGQYRLSIEGFQAAAASGLKLGSADEAVRQLNNAASAQLATFQYQEAMRSFEEARQLCTRHRLTRLAPVIELNIAVLYITQGQYEDAIRIGEATLSKLDPSFAPMRRAFAINIAQSHEQLGHHEIAAATYRRVSDEADAAGDARQMALVWDRLGDLALKTNALTDAEAYYCEAFRLRRLGVKEDLYLSYPRLGKLRLRQQRPAEASHFLDLAVESQKSDPRQFPLYAILGFRAEARAMAGQLAGASADFREALRLAQVSRRNILPSGATQSRWESAIDDFRTSFIRFGVDQAESSEFVIATLAAAEESRMGAIRALGSGAWRKRLPESYWELLAKLRQAETASAGRLGAASGQPDQSQQLRFELAHMEAQAGAGAINWTADPAGAARRFVRTLDPKEAAFSFYLDEPFSYRWTVVRGQVTVARIPGRSELRRLAAEFRNAVEAGETPDEALYRALFTGTPAAALEKPHWLIALDDVLFSVPLAALRADGHYLIERHAIRQSPSLFLTGPKRRTEEPSLLTVSDPVYNQADPRLADRSAAPAGQGLDLPRLASSAQEARRAAAAWAGAATSLEGAAVNLESLRQSLAASPAAVHLATHFVQGGEAAARPMMALGYGRGREPLFLGPEQIAAFETRPNVVVMSGCESGSGEAVKGAGLLGLTRAWLVAGAESVAASLWVTRDEAGAIFEPFYKEYSRELTEGRPHASAVALQRAQLQMLQAPDWRRSPRYWAAFFLVSRG